jgi:hypothetical protein
MPILEYLDTRGSGDLVSVGEISAATGIDGNKVVDEIERLRSAGFITSNSQKRMTGGDPSPWFLQGARLGERGARAVGIWPNEDQYQALLELLEQRIAGFPRPGREGPAWAVGGRTGCGRNLRRLDSVGSLVARPGSLTSVRR